MIPKTAPPQHATIDLGNQPPYVASIITADNLQTKSGSAHVTVTDVCVSPSNGNQVRVFLRAELEGLLAGDSANTRGFEFSGSPLRRGDSIPIETADYQVSGTITDLVPERTTLSVNRTPVVLETTVGSTIAQSITPASEYRLAGRTIATVDSITRHPTKEPNTTRVILGATLQTIERDDRIRFAGKDVKPGSTVTIDTDSYTIEGKILQVGERTLPGKTTETTAVLKVPSVAPEIADDIRPGMTESLDGTTYARIDEKRMEPARVVVTSDDGNIYAREHPFKEDVYLTVTLDTHQSDFGLTFHGRSLRTGDDVVLDLGSIRIRATVIELD